MQILKFNKVLTLSSINHHSGKCLFFFCGKKPGFAWHKHFQKLSWYFEKLSCPKFDSDWDSNGKFELRIWGQVAWVSHVAFGFHVLHPVPWIFPSVKLVEWLVGDFIWNTGLLTFARILYTSFLLWNCRKQNDSLQNLCTIMFLFEFKEWMGSSLRVLFLIPNQNRPGFQHPSCYMRWFCWDFLMVNYWSVGFSGWWRSYPKKLLWIPFWIGR